MKHLKAVVRGDIAVLKVGFDSHVLESNIVGHEGGEPLEDDAVAGSERTADVSYPSRTETFSP